VRLVVGQTLFNLFKTCGGLIVPKSVLDAIKEGSWNFEPEDVELDKYSATLAVPGTKEKLDVLAARAKEGLPLWHDCDQADYDCGR